MIAGSGTFDCVGTVGASAALPWSVEMRSTREGPSAEHGIASGPLHLVVDEAGPVPNPGYDRALWRPSVLRARFSLATGRWGFLSRTVWRFHLDLSLAKALQPGDLIYVSRTGTGGIGVSAIRDRQLVFAVGAVTAVPLGDGVTALRSSELVREAEEVFRRYDPTFELPEWPVYLEVEGQRLVSLRARCTVGAYEVDVVSGFRRGMPGTAEAVAISRRGLCSPTGASASAQLLTADRLAEDS